MIQALSTQNLSSTLLSVNLNKVALLRNSRGGVLPDPLFAARVAVEAGCAGITLHPRPDLRHARPDDARVLAILDWELSTLGHPLADFSYHAMMYRMTSDFLAGIRDYDLPALNIPSEEEYISAYCRRTGRTGIPNYDFYIAFNQFRLAAIYHGIKGRYLRGNASNAAAAQRAEQFPQLAALARESMEACRSRG